MIPDPLSETTWIIESAADETWGAVLGPTTLVNVHLPSTCAGQHCAVHNPSDHHMRSWPLNWRGDRRIMERTCPHGVGHPDPDDVAYRRRTGLGGSTHGCDGCCAGREGVML